MELSCELASRKIVSIFSSLSSVRPSGPTNNQLTNLKYMYKNSTTVARGGLRDLGARGR